MPKKEERGAGAGARGAAAAMVDGRFFGLLSLSFSFRDGFTSALAGDADDGGDGDDGSPWVGLRPVLLNWLPVVAEGFGVRFSLIPFLGVMDDSDSCCVCWMLGVDVGVDGGAVELSEVEGGLGVVGELVAAERRWLSLNFRLVYLLGGVGGFGVVEVGAVVVWFGAAVPKGD